MIEILCFLVGVAVGAYCRDSILRLWELVRR